MEKGEASQASEWTKEDWVRRSRGRHGVRVIDWGLTAMTAATPR